MTVKLLNEPHFRFRSSKGGRTGSSEYTLVKMPHCWKSRVTGPLKQAAKTEGSQCIRAVPPVLAADKHIAGNYPAEVSDPKILLLHWIAVYTVLTHFFMNIQIKLHPL